MTHPSVANLLEDLFKIYKDQLSQRRYLSDGYSQTIRPWCWNDLRGIGWRTSPGEKLRRQARSGWSPLPKSCHYIVRRSKPGKGCIHEGRRTSCHHRVAPGRVWMKCRVYCRSNRSCRNSLHISGKVSRRRTKPPWYVHPLAHALSSTSSGMNPKYRWREQNNFYYYLLVVKTSSSRKHFR